MPLRQINRNNTWDQGCDNCRAIESQGHASMRTGMNQGLGIHGRYDLEGPARIDIMFDIGCNLACRICGPSSSTYWQKHLIQHGEWTGGVTAPRRQEDVIQALSRLDLTNLRQVVFCGGETLMGQSYWNVCEWLVKNTPNAKQQLTLCFQTNGTQPINPRNYHVIDSVHLVKLHVSLDGIEQRFEYQRWPAQWQQVVHNLQTMKQQVPSNVMFLVEETVGILNVLYQHELAQWMRSEFATNREGDPVDHTRHLARGPYALESASMELVQAMRDQGHGDLVPVNWQEQPDLIHHMIETTKRFDSYRSQNLADHMPELWQCYRRFW